MAGVEAGALAPEGLRERAQCGLLIPLFLYNLLMQHALIAAFACAPHAAACAAPFAVQAAAAPAA